MWRFGTWFSRHGGVGLMVGLDDLRGLFQPTSLWYILTCRIHLTSNDKISHSTQQDRLLSCCATTFLTQTLQFPFHFKFADLLGHAGPSIFSARCISASPTQCYCTLFSLSYACKGVGTSSVASTRVCIIHIAYYSFSWVILLQIKLESRITAVASIKATCISVRQQLLHCFGSNGVLVNFSPLPELCFPISHIKLN